VALRGAPRRRQRGAPVVLVVHRSNRADVLAHALGDVVASAPLPPLQTERVVVHGRRMAGWLSMRLAERFGVWSGAQFPFPRRFVTQLMELALPGHTDALLLDERDSLQWLVLPQLDRRLDDPAFAELRRYCRDEPGARSGHAGRGDPSARNEATLRRFGLAAKIAGLFDRYLVHRPEMVLHWERGGSIDDWQAILWRDVVAARGGEHFAALLESAVARLRRGEVVGLPPRVSFFGIASLPPSYLQLVAALAEATDVHLFVPSPSMVWWAEIRSQRRRAAPVDLEDAPDEGHPLLASLGTLGRDFQRLLESDCAYVEPPVDLYREPAADTALGVVQGDLLHLRARGGDPLGRVGEPALPLDDADASIAVFSCHSRLREVEVLHDRLLALLAADPTLQPRDIVVYLTDVDGYAPLVEAVFERDREDATQIPFSIADRSPRACNPTIEAWLRILALVGSRMTASAVLDLLALEPVAARFGFTPDDLDTIARWVDGSGVRWGIDGAHRGTHGQPELEATTWRFGLRRLLLGHAMPGGGRTSFAGVLPFDEIEGQRTELLGRLVAACETLFGLAASLATPRSVATWQIDLEVAIAAVLAARPGGHWELDDIRQAIAKVARSAAAARFEGEVPLTVMRDAVVACLDDGATVRGSANTGVSFAALQPMRAVGSRVVVVLGLQDGVFPRADHGVDFDAMRQTPRPGDRSLRDDDRYAFLEAVVAAGERLLLGYVGQSSQDDRDLPPSVVLAEFLDVLGAAFFVPGTEAASPGARAAAVRRRLVVRQPMQPFSPRNFGADPDPRLFSYSVPYYEGARTLASNVRRERAVLFTEALPPIDPAIPVELDRFVKMLQLPQAQLLRRRLDVELKDWSRERTDREPMELDQLEQWQLGEELLRLRLDGVEDDRARELLAQAGTLPLGSMGKATFSTLAASVEPLVQSTLELRGGLPLPAREVTLDVGGMTLVGHLRHRHERGLAITHFGRLSAKHLLELWVLHLVATAIDPDAAHEAVVIARASAEDDGAAAVVRFAPVADPRPILADLAALYRDASSEPVLLFPKASFAYYERLEETGDPDAALGAARSVFGSNAGGDGKEPAVQRIFGDHDPLAPGYSLFERPMAGGDFAALAVRVFGPIFAHRRSR